MKKTKPLKKSLSLSKETVRSLKSDDLVRAAGGAIVTTDESNGPDHNSCNTACPQWSCQVC
jgi:hypothetical protein